MKREEQRIAIAEALGFQRLLGDPWKMLGELAWMPPAWTIRQFIMHGEPAVYLRGLPDYLNDLNAMHEAEKVLLDRQDWSGCDYEQALKDMTSSWCWHATAAQRAEAFLKTLNLWTT